MAGQDIGPGIGLFKCCQCLVDGIAQIFGILGKGKTTPAADSDVIDDRVHKVFGQLYLVATFGELGSRQAGGGISIGAASRDGGNGVGVDRKSTRLNSSHVANSYAVSCFKK